MFLTNENFYMLKLINSHEWYSFKIFSNTQLTIATNNYDSFLSQVRQMDIIDSKNEVM